MDPEVLALGRTAAVLPNLELKLGGVGDEEPSGVFDIVVCTDVLEHIADDRAAFRWLADRVRPAGSLILRVPGAPQRHLFRNIDTALAQEVAAGRGPHPREGYGAPELAANVGATGLRVTRVAATFHNPPVRLAEDVDTMLFARRLRPVKALLLPLLLTAASFERCVRTGRHGYGLLLCARKDDA